ncbi:MAG: MAPEG family protein [Acidobacteria bacterium]|nr:MAPEG family protein [Acidobacteriota bacterium]
MKLDWPMMAMVFWTFIMLVTIFLNRVRSVRTGRVPARYFKTLQGEAPDDIVKGTRHFANLFEMPVLFYAACLFSLQMEMHSRLLFGLAWLFVACRIAHSLIHLGYNKVTHRLAIFFLSNIALFAIWARIALFVYRR